MIRVGASKSARLRADARSAVGAHLNVKWTDMAIPYMSEKFTASRDAYQAIVDATPGIKKANRPSMIFVFSDEMKPQPKNRRTPPQATKQQRDSVAAWAELFQKSGDYSTFIPGRFFSVVRMDATEVDESRNRYLHSEAAPVVILTRRDGTVDAVYSGRSRIKLNTVVRSMLNILRKDGYITSVSHVPRLNQYMRELEKCEMEIALAKERAAEYEAKYRQAVALDKKRAKRRKKPVQYSSSTRAALKNLNKALERVHKERLPRYNVLKKEYLLLKQMGLPDDRMPPEPKMPKKPVAKAA